LSASLLPGLVALVRDAGSRLVLVRPAVEPSLPASEADPVPVDTVSAVRALLGPDFLDLSEEVYGPGSWLDAIHLAPAASRRFSARLGARLRDLPPLDAFSGPSRIPPGETVVWTGSGPPARAIRVRVAGIGTAATGVSVAGAPPAVADGAGRLVATLVHPPPPPWRIEISAPEHGPALEVLDVRAGSGEALLPTAGDPWNTAEVLVAGDLPVARAELRDGWTRWTPNGVGATLDRAPSLPWGCIPLGPPATDCRTAADARCTDGAALFSRGGPPPAPQRTCEEAGVLWILPGDTVRLAYGPARSVVLDAVAPSTVILELEGASPRTWSARQPLARLVVPTAADGTLIVKNPSPSEPILLRTAESDPDRPPTGYAARPSR
jgi:hypothetical protein